jgi:hypothetical protein
MRTIAIAWMVCLVETGIVSGEQLAAARCAASLKSVPAAELPAAAALLMKASGPQNPTEAATNLVKVAVRINPAATPAIVGAVVRAAPEMASAVSHTAATEVPGLAPAITTAAVGAAPARAAEIVVAVCSVTPAEYRNVVLAAARAAPCLNKEILKAVGVVRPDLKPFIEIELARYPRANPSVSRCLDRAELAQARAAAAGAGLGTSSGRVPQSGGPRSPLLPPGHGGSLPPRGDEVPPGGRNYARP